MDVTDICIHILNMIHKSIHTVQEKYKLHF